MKQTDNTQYHRIENQEQERIKDKTISNIKQNNIKYKNTKKERLFISDLVCFLQILD